MCSLLKTIGIFNKSIVFAISVFIFIFQILTNKKKKNLKNHVPQKMTNTIVTKNPLVLNQYKALE